MSKSRLLILVAALSYAITAVSADKPDVKTYKGEIADSSCALNVHSLTRSHKEMLKNKSMGGTNASCTQYCVQNMGADYVLAEHENVYRLDGKSSNFWQNLAGKQVKVRGTLDPKTKTIQVLDVEQ